MPDNVFLKLQACRQKEICKTRAEPKASIRFNASSAPCSFFLVHFAPCYWQDDRYPRPLCRSVGRAREETRDAERRSDVHESEYAVSLKGWGAKMRVEIVVTFS